MRTHRLLLTVGLLISAPTVAAAQSLEIGGMRIELGASEDSVLMGLKDWPGIELRQACAESEAACHEWIIWLDPPPYESAGFVRFQHGGVVMASRDWAPRGEDSPMAAIRGAVSALRSAGAGENCMVLDESKDAPDYHLTSVNVRCGRRGVRMSAIQASGHSEGFTITEYIRE